MLSPPGKIETLRTLFVWIIDLFLYYFVGKGGVGEPWTAYSWVQLFGFILLVAGTLTYNYRQIMFESEHDIPEAETPTQLEIRKTNPVAFGDHYDEEEEVRTTSSALGMFGATFAVGYLTTPPLDCVRLFVFMPSYLHTGTRPQPLQPALRVSCALSLHCRRDATGSLVPALSAENLDKSGI